MTTAAQKREERDEAVARLRKQIKPGDTIYTILRSVSRSGMSRSISVVKPDGSGGIADHFDGTVARAIGERFDRNAGGVKMQGAGMDMGFQLVYVLGRVLFPEGFGCIGEGCGSNDHSNGDRDYTKHTKKRPHWHTDGGYALRHRWL